MKILLLILLSFSVYAQSVTLENIEVTASTLDDVEDKVIIQETTPGMSQPIIEGTMGDQINITVDDIKFSNSLFRSGPNQYYSWIPKDFVISTTLNNKYDSLGASIDRTLGVDYSHIGYSSNISDNKFIGKYKSNDYEFAVLSDYRANVVDTDGEVQNSGYNQKGLMFIRKADYGKTTFLMSQSDDVDRTDKFESGNYYVYDLQRYILLSHKHYISDTTTLTPSYQRFDERIDRNNVSKNVDSTINMFGIDVDSYHDLASGYITYGIENNFEDVSYNSDNYNYNVASLYGTYNSNYNKYKYTLRYKYSIMTATGSGLDRTLDNHSAGVTLKRNLSVGTIYTSFDLGYKFPTITNLAAARDDSVSEISNPNLKQEKSYITRLGYEYNGFKTSIFYKDFSDLIIREQTNISDGSGGFMWKYNNTNSGYMKGINAEYSNKYNSGLSVFLFAEYIEGRNDYDYWSKLTPLQSTAKISQDISIIDKDKVFIEWRYAPRVSSDELALKDQTDIRIQNHNYGYNIMNLGYNTDYGRNFFEVALNNVFDRKGRVLGSSTDFNERNVKVTYKYRF